MSALVSQTCVSYGLHLQPACDSDASITEEMLPLITTQETGKQFSAVY